MTWRWPRFRSPALTFTLAATLLVPATALAEDEAPPLSIYGFARLDVLADDSRLNDVHRPMYVLAEPSGGQFDGQFTMTPRMSRLGLGIDEWEFDDDGDVKGEGKLEIDFGGASSGVNLIRLRHAYAQLVAHKKVEVLAGHTWDLISPLFPSAQNDAQLLFAGNTGDRRPQIRLTALPNDKVRFGVAVAASGMLEQHPGETSAAVAERRSPTPMVQALLEVRKRMRRGTAMRLGLWGHASSEKDETGTAHTSTSAGAHFYIPIMPIVVWMGEGYVGRNLPDIGGGIGQGVNPMTGRRIRSLGGWFETAVVPTPRHMLAFGFSGDLVPAREVEMGDRTANGTVYGVVRYRPKTTLQVGLEYLYWKTVFKDAGAGIANRVNLHLSVFF